MATSEQSLELNLENLSRELRLGWSDSDQAQLMAEFEPYIDWIETFLSSGEDFPSHIENSGSIAIPIAETTTPAELFAALGSGVHFTVKEHDRFWITVHYPNPEPVVTLLPKALPGIPRKLIELCDRCTEYLGLPTGGPGGMFLAYLLPGFSWAMHTDHDNLYEQIASRVHVPLITNPDSLYVWGRIDGSRKEHWLVTTHLEQGKVYHVRVDVPHTVVNNHSSVARLHLILDVREEPIPSNNH